MTEGESGNPERRSRTAPAARLLLWSALVYLGGVAVGALLRWPDPWSHAIVALGGFLGGALAKLWAGRVRRDGSS